MELKVRIPPLALAMTNVRAARGAELWRDDATAKLLGRNTDTRRNYTPLLIIYVSKACKHKDRISPSLSFSSLRPIRLEKHAYAGSCMYSNNNFDIIRFLPIEATFID